MDYFNEQQQVDQLKAWWKEYGLGVVGGVILAIIIVLGIRFYTRYETNKGQEASSLYTMMMNSVLSDQADSAKTSANQLITKYARTPYASIARLWLAKNAADSQNYTEANAQLTWVMQHAGMRSLREVARIRDAQIFLQQNNPSTALSVLSTLDDKGYKGLVDEVRADAYIQMHEPDLARTYYKKALDEIPSPTLSQPLLAMKLANLPAGT